jgi:hypothetical protein
MATITKQNVGVAIKELGAASSAAAAVTGANRYGVREFLNVTGVQTAELNARLRAVPNVAVPNVIVPPGPNQNMIKRNNDVLGYLKESFNGMVNIISECITLLNPRATEEKLVQAKIRLDRALALHRELCERIKSKEHITANNKNTKADDIRLLKDQVLAIVTAPANAAAAGPAVPAAAIKPANVGNAGRVAAAAAVPAPAAAAQLPPPPQPALAPLPAAPAGVAGPPLPTDATPVDFGDTATGVKGKTAVFQFINIDASKYVRAAPNVNITKDVKIYAVSYVPVGGKRMYELIPENKIFQNISGKGIAVEFNNTPQTMNVKFYTNPPLKTQGGRRRTKAKSKRKTKASRKTTRRNRRS